MAASALVAVTAPYCAVAESDRTDQFFFFPAAGYAWRSDNPTGHERKRDGELQLDLFYTADVRGLRLLGEIFGKANGDEELEIERLQLSWKLGDDSRLWLGRFHNPIGLWNTEYHHGVFLQTSISRPGIVEFEDHGGVIPTHLTGALLDGYDIRSGAVWRYEIAVGVGPELKTDLRPLEIHAPGAGSHEPGVTARLSWQPADSQNTIALFAGGYRIPGADPTPIDVRQRLAGASTHWQFGARTALFATAYVVDNELSTPSATIRDAFRNGNVQIERTVIPQWTVYARAEGSRGADNDAYLDLFHAFVRERQVVGVRHELTKNQAVKLEVSKVDRMDEHYNQAAVQWSAVYP